MNVSPRLPNESHVRRQTMIYQFNYLTSTDKIS